MAIANYIADLIADYIVTASLFGLLAIIFSAWRREDELTSMSVGTSAALIFAMVALPVYNVSGPITDAAKEKLTSNDEWQEVANPKVRADDLRIQLTQITIPTELVSEFSIGGDNETDWIYVSGLSNKLISFETDSNSEDVRSRTVDIVANPVYFGRGSVASYEWLEGARSPTFMGAIELPRDALICANCNSTDEPAESIAPSTDSEPNSIAVPIAADCKLRVPRGSDRLMMDDIALPSIPRRTLNFIPLPTNYNVNQRIFSIRNFGRPLEDVDVPDACRSFVDQRDETKLPTGFIFWRSGVSLPQAMLIPEATPQNTRVTLTPGGPTIRLRTYLVRYAERNINTYGIDPDADLFERISERRSFRIRLLEDGSLIVSYDTPEFLQIRAPNLAVALEAKKTQASNKYQPLTLIFDSTGVVDKNGGFADAVVEFKSLGPVIARATIGKILLPVQNRRRTDLEDYVIVPNANPRLGNATGVNWGEPFTLGRNVKATIKIDRLDSFARLSSTNYLFLCLAFSLMFYALWSDVHLINTRMLSVAICAQALLGLRMLISISGEFVDPEVTRGATSGTTLFLFAAVPIILRRAGGTQISPIKALLAFAVLLLAWMIIWRTDQLGMLSMIVGVAAIAALLSFDHRLIDLLPTRLTSFGRKGALRITSSAQSAAQWCSRRDFAHMVLLICLMLVIIRIGSAVFGAKEAISFGGTRFSQSIWYIPIVSFIFALIWHEQARRDDFPPYRPYVLFALGLGALYLVPALLINDVGIVVFSLGVLAYFAFQSVDVSDWRSLTHAGFWFAASLLLVLAIFGGYQSRFSTFHYLLLLTSIGTLAVYLWHAVSSSASPVVASIRDVRWSFAFLSMIAFLLAFNVPGITANPTEQIVDVSGANQTAELEEKIARSQNALRILSLLDPESAQSTGTAESERLNAALAHYSDYTDCPARDGIRCRIRGQTFLGVPRPTELLAVHMDDNVSAIYLVAQFGRSAAAGLILLLLAMAAITTKTDQINRGDDFSLTRALRIYSAILTWVIALVALYMVLANFRVVPFTGQNVFFLAASSGSDALFSITMFTLAVFGLRESTNE